MDDLTRGDSAEATQQWETVSQLVGDPAAVELLRLLNHVANVWDDLTDGDLVDARALNFAFESLLIHIPRNRFYRAHQAELQPLVEVAIADWHAANAMQASSDDEEVLRAHVLRFNLLSVWVMCARLVGGLDAAKRAAEVLRRTIPSERFADFLAEVRA